MMTGRRLSGCVLQGGHAAQVVVLGQGDVGVNGFGPGGISEDGPDVGLGQPGRLP